MRLFRRARESKPGRDGDRAPTLKRSILFRTTLLFGVVIILTLGLFLALIIPFQQRALAERMEALAEVVATSVEQVTVSSIVVEDYSSVIEHCMKVANDRKIVLFLVIVRKDGFSLTHHAGGWSYGTLKGAWNPSFDAGPRKAFLFSDLVHARVFHYSYPLRYSGIDWGWIHVGLDIRQYAADLRAIYIQSALLALVCIGAGALISIGFGRRLSRPLIQLHEIMRRVGKGDLMARAEITTGDEVEGLAHTFNTMTESLEKARTGLEIRVIERTADLLKSNNLLKEEILERQRAQEARDAAEKQLEQQRALSARSDHLRSLGEMAAGIAHELNQPLVGVRGLAEHMLIGMERGWDNSEKKLRDRLTRIVEQADRMVHIIEHIRKFAREAGKPTVSFVRVNEAVDASLSLLSAQFRSRGIDLSVEEVAGIPPVSANPFSLEEVILNLLINARDAVEERMSGNVGEPPYTPRIVVRTLTERREGRDGVALLVEDNGSGIPPEVIGRVFEPFFTTKDPDKGTGLGLAISRTIIEDFGGRIGITSRVGEGTQVSVWLPVAEAARQQEVS